MTNPVILLGTQSNGETLPVQVDATGRLVAEGLEGPPGPQGEQGPQGEPGPPGEPGTAQGGVKSITHVEMLFGERIKEVEIDTQFLDGSKTVINDEGKYMVDSNGTGLNEKNFFYELYFNASGNLYGYRTEIRQTIRHRLTLVEYR